MNCLLNSLKGGATIALGLLIAIAGSPLPGGLEAHASRVNCESGMAAGFPCSRIDLISKVDLKNSGLESKSGNDVWGWADSLTKREYALMGLSNKTAVVDVTDAENPVHIADFPSQSRGSIWRDIKIYKDHAFIVSEASGHGLQIFDLKVLRAIPLNVTEPMIIDNFVFYSNFESAHNIFINEETGFAYVVGTNTCDAGAHVIDVRNPESPRFMSCIDRDIFSELPEHSDDFQFAGADDTYTHDIHCVVYRGKDVRFFGHEICVASNADTVNIVDVTDKSNPVELGAITYKGVGFVHQGWMTEDHAYFLLGDEIDEMISGENTKTYIFDLDKLDEPKLIGKYVATTKAIDHNLYVKGKYVYQSNYRAGLRILSLDEIAQGKMSEVAYFDTFPESDDANFSGAWSVFPFFSSGNILISNMDGFLFVVRASLP